MNEPEEYQRGWLYRHDCPEGKIFEAIDIGEKLSEGWVDSPAKIDEPQVEPKAQEPAPAPVVKTNGWPQLVDGLFIDSNGTGFDPSQHQQTPGEGPVMNKDGSFRKLPGPKATV